MRIRKRDNAEYVAELGRRVRLMRKFGGLTLDNLADRTDMSKTGIWQIEQGRSEPSASTLLRLSLALNCSVEYLVKGDIERDDANRA
jgi:transcriptional regulator with XRE-family HTH domain